MEPKHWKYKGKDNCQIECGFRIWILLEIRKMMYNMLWLKLRLRIKMNFKIREDWGIIYKGIDKYNRNSCIRRSYREENMNCKDKEDWKKKSKEKDCSKEDSMKPGKEHSLIKLRDREVIRNRNLFQKLRLVEEFMNSSWDLENKGLRDNLKYQD